MKNFQTIFPKKNPIIGMVHLMPLPGYNGFYSMDAVIKNALKDATALKEGGVDAIMVENNYDIPHNLIVEPETVAAMTVVAREIVQNSKLPIGLSVLWNDYRAALSIAKVVGGTFVRIPVFVDTVKTSYGTVMPEPEKIVEYRKKIHAENIALLTDIHVKHAQILNRDTIQQSAKKAIKKGSDALIITGKWTADAPLIDDLSSVRKIANKFPIFVGSGMTKHNAHTLLQYANGAIVGTTFKTGTNKENEVNVREYSQRISKKKVAAFMKCISEKE